MLEPNYKNIFEYRIIGSHLDRIYIGLDIRSDIGLNICTAIDFFLLQNWSESATMLSGNWEGRVQQWRRSRQPVWSECWCWCWCWCTRLDKSHLQPHHCLSAGQVASRSAHQVCTPGLHRNWTRAQQKVPLRCASFADIYCRWRVDISKHCQKSSASNQSHWLQIEQYLQHWQYLQILPTGGDTCIKSNNFLGKGTKKKARFRSRWLRRGPDYNEEWNGGKNMHFT